MSNGGAKNEKEIIRMKVVWSGGIRDEFRKKRIVGNDKNESE